MLPVALSQLSPHPRTQKTSRCCLSLRRKENRPAKVPVRGPSIEEVNRLIYFYESEGVKSPPRKDEHTLYGLP